MTGRVLNQALPPNLWDHRSAAEPPTAAARLALQRAYPGSPPVTGPRERDCSDVGLDRGGRSGRVVNAEDSAG